MYGTANQICARLLTSVRTEQKLSVIVITEDELREILANDELCPELAADVLAGLSQAYQAGGEVISCATVGALYARVKAEREKVKVTVCQEQLAAVVNLARAEGAHIYRAGEDEETTRARAALRALSDLMA